MAGIDESRGGWITYTNWVLDCRPMIDHPIALRKDFRISQKPSGGTLIVSAADRYGLWLNGRLVGYGPARSYPRNKLYDEYDISGFLRRGINRLAAIITPCTGANFLACYTRMALFLQADIRTAGGKRVLVASDDTWASRIADWIGTDYLLISTPVGWQEHVDKALEPRNWRVAKPGSSWTPALYLGPAGMPPWINLLPRPVPLLVEKPITPSLVWQGRGSKRMAEAGRNLARLFNRETLDGERVPAATAKGVFTGAGGSVRVFDFGTTRLIRPGLQITGVAAPARIELYYDIKLADRPTAATGFRFVTDGNADSCMVAPGSHTWETLVPRGFRFMTVKVSGAGRADYRLACRSVDYPYGDAASFQSGDPFLSRTWEVSTNNIRSSTNDAAVDCCNRENLLWEFDAVATLKAAFYSFGETKMWRRCLNILAEGIDSDGRPSAIAPTDVPSSLYGQSMHLPISIFEYFMATGDRSLLESAAPALRRYLDFCSRYVTGEDLFVPPMWSWHWVDWAPIDKRPYSLPINALLVMCCDASARIASAIGDRSFAGIAARLGGRVRKAIRAFYDHGEQAFRSRIEPKTRLILAAPKPNSVTSPVAMTLTHNVHANVLAALARCGTAAMRRNALKHAAGCFALPPAPINEIGTGYVDILLSPLLAAGHAAAAMHKVRSIYQPFLDVDAPTWGETANEVDKFNTAHGWSAAVNSLIVEGLIGLSPAAPGWKAISLEPPAAVNADYSYSIETPAGVVSIARARRRISARWPRGVTLRFGGRMRKGTGKAAYLT